MVERQRALGGTCLLWGCIPTKALLEHAHALDVVRRANDWGITMPADHAPAIDMPRVIERQDAIVGGLSKGIEFLFRKNRIEWVKGSARLLGDGKVLVSGTEEQTLTAGHVVIATGSAPRSAEGIALDGSRVITSDEAIKLTTVPRSMAILGGGAVGVEFASIFRRFGSAVTLIELEPRLVPTEDEAVSAQLEKSFARQGIRVLTRTRLVGVTPGPVGLALEALGPEGTLAMDADILLVAIGRKPVTDGLGIEELGAQTDRGFIRVDALYRTSIPDVSAIGDVISLGAVPHPQLAHVSSMEGVLVAERVAGLPVQPLEYDHVPHCTYCDPRSAASGSPRPRHGAAATRYG